MNFERILHNLSRFLEIKLEIYELKIKEQLSEALANIAAILFVLLFAILGIFFLSIALGYYLNELFKSNFLGMIVVGAFYLTIGFVVYRYKDRIITRRILKAVFKETITESENEQDQAHEIEY